MNLAWWKARFLAAVDSFTEDAFKWLFGGITALLLLLGATALGIQQQVIAPPWWWPFQAEAPPPQSAELVIDRNNVGGVADEGYGFVGQAYDDIQELLDGTGSLDLSDPGLRQLRVCRDLRLTKEADARALITALVAKLAPCVTLTETPEGAGTRFSLAPSDDPALQRIEMNGTTNLFCGCRDAVLDAFRETPGLP